MIYSIQAVRQIKETCSYHISVSVVKVMAIAIVMQALVSPNSVALLLATKSNGLPPPLPGCVLGLRVGFVFSSLVDVGCWSFVV